jgi:hypothetical protein
VQFFHGFGLKDDSIKIGKYPNGKLTGDAVVLFESGDDAKLALNERQKQSIGHRYIELFQIT